MLRTRRLRACVIAYSAAMGCWRRLACPISCSSRQAWSKRGTSFLLGGLLLGLRLLTFQRKTRAD